MRISHLYSLVKPFKQTRLSINPFLSWSLLMVLGFGCMQAQESPDRWNKFIRSYPDKHFSTWIKNAQVLDGTGNPSFPADLITLDDRIVYVGPVLDTSLRIDRIIEASGLYLAPGFIDAHAHGNPLKEDAFVNFLAMGVTSVCVGQDGTSPMTEDIREWFNRVNSVPQLINIIPMVGHGTLRVLSGIQYAKQPDRILLDAMMKLLDDALKAGCFGLTTGLEYEPGGFADSVELNLLAKTTGSYHRLIMSHIRNEDDDVLLQSINELARLGKYTPVQVSHIKSVYGKGKDRGLEILAELHRLRADGIPITQDWYPYTASYTGLSILFPEWAKPPNDYTKAVRERKSELQQYLSDKVNSRNGPDATLFGSGPYQGLTLTDVSSRNGKPFEDILIELGPSGASAAYFIMDEALQSELLKDSMTMICSDGSPDMYHPRGYGSFVKIITDYVRDKQVLTLPEAVRKMTGLPASTLQLEDRGTIREGNYADLILFNPEKLQAPATYQNPHELAQGMEWVLVNGQEAWHNESIQLHAGQLLLKK